MSFVCKYCTKEFYTKLKLEHHQPACLWLHTPRKTRQEEIESLDARLTDGQRDKMLRDLMYQMTHMQQKIKSLTLEITKIRSKQRINILQWLNSPTQTTILPKESVNEWFQNIPISQQHLEQVFLYDLMAGLKLCISDHIQSFIFLKTSPPFCAFTQKAKTIYIYEKNHNPDWCVLDTNKMKKLTNILVSRFFEMFLKWETEQEEYILTDEGQEKDIIFMKKFMGGSIENIPRMNKLFTWLYSVIQKEQCFVQLSFDDT